MNTMMAYMRKMISTNRETRVFDWDKAARIIRDSGTKEACAALEDDEEWTGGRIFLDGKPYMDDYTYLESVWAIPTLSILTDDGELESHHCWVWKHEKPEWNNATKWPQSSLDILNREINNSLNEERRDEYGT